MGNLWSQVNSEELRKTYAWSLDTFGPGLRTKGIIEHITKELKEVEADPTDLMEWIDIIILALDGACRAGHSTVTILDAIQLKWEINKKRQWPDWRELSEDQAIEHIR